VALTIAGSDSGGGAGIQADLKTFEAFAVFGTTAITAVTAQNTRGVFAVAVLEPSMIRAQIRAVYEDLAPRAAKTGMLANAAGVGAVAGALRETGLAPVVVDPVMVATSGDRLLDEDAVETLRERLLPLAAILTPNVPEAELLLGRTLSSVEALREAAPALAELGPAAVLLKGGHLPGPEIVDVAWDGRELREFRAPRIDTRHTHGTGCTLSAAIAAGLARGADRWTAIEMAIDYTRRAIASAPGLGSGHGPLAHRVPVEPR
jgi:hydroxymethylpyrimidine/phosphomethylpyrimidine kinase